MRSNGPELHKVLPSPTAIGDPPNEIKVFCFHWFCFSLRRRLPVCLWHCRKSQRPPTLPVCCMPKAQSVMVDSSRGKSSARRSRKVSGRPWVRLLALHLQIKPQRDASQVWQPVSSSSQGISQIPRPQMANRWLPFVFSLDFTSDMVTPAGPEQTGRFLRVL